MNETLEGGKVSWTGQGFLEDGTSVTATGSGTWKKDPSGHAWHIDYELLLNDGSKIRSVGQIDLSTLKYTEIHRNQLFGLKQKIHLREIL
jgi:hypothetical protein